MWFVFGKNTPPPPQFKYWCIGALQRAQQLSPPRRREAQQVYLKATRKKVQANHVIQTSL